MQKKISHILFTLAAFLMFCCNHAPSAKAQYTKEAIDLEELSVDFITAIKKKESVERYIQSLSKIHPDSLATAMRSPFHKKAFWINIYNAFIQYHLDKDPSLYEDRSKFFSESRMTIAGKELSFDDIEHGILRASTLKFSLGYLKNPFSPEYINKLRVAKIDERIHFALNCGAKSCPPIAIYTADHFDRKVNEVARSFLKRVSTFDREENKVYTTSLFSWFRGDFGGENGIRRTLINYGVLPLESDADIKFNDYDWTLRLGDFYEVDH